MLRLTRNESRLNKSYAWILEYRYPGVSSCRKCPPLRYAFVEQDMAMKCGRKIKQSEKKKRNQEKHRKNLDNRYHNKPQTSIYTQVRLNACDWHSQDGQPCYCLQLARLKSTDAGYTHSGNTLITLPPIRLWQMPQTRSSVMVTCRERVDRPSVPSPTNNCACVLMSSAFCRLATIRLSLRIVLAARIRPLK